MLGMSLAELGPSVDCWHRCGDACAALLAVPALHTPPIPSIFSGEMLDLVAEIISWVAIVIAPIFGITVFWLLHIMPEKIAIKRKHPQVQAIHTLCLLSLFFGGLLWPFAFLWAYSKPVFYKMAYGTDVGAAHGVAEPEAKADVHEVEHVDEKAERERSREREGLD
jgi:hypothetical protein